jgi:site-specific DNA recombinase
LRIIREFDALDIEVNAVEQNLDMSIPDNKVMLAVYLAIPEVENDKNSSRTTEGSRRARVEGSWTGTAPIGYRNYRNEIGKSTLIPNANADLVKEAFEIMAKGIYAADEVRRMMKNKGLRLTRQGFLNMLLNIAYVGKIEVKEWKREPTQIVNGLHDAIIDEETFNKVNDILKGKRKTVVAKKRSDELLLRGYLICPKCEGNLTGSKSRGRNHYYHYYHCNNNNCKTRFRADEANNSFVRYLASFSFSQEVLSLYHQIIEDVFETNDGNRNQAIDAMEKELSKIREMLASAEDKFVNDLIDNAAYKGMQGRYRQKENDLIMDITLKKASDTNFKKYIGYGFTLISNLDQHFSRSPLEVQQKIIGSIFPEKLVYENKTYRTKRLNEVIRVLTNNINGFGDYRNENVGRIADKSIMAPPAGLEPATL